MRYLIHDNKGFALLTTLMLMVLGFGIVATLLYMITQSTKTTRLGQKYAVALDAAKGGADMIIHMMENELFSPPTLLNAIVGKAECLKDNKMVQPTMDGNGRINWSESDCTPNAITGSTCTIDQVLSSDPKICPDLSLMLASHQVYVKIVHRTDTTTNSLYMVIVRSEVPDRREHVEISFLYQVPLPET